jgi:peroxiredoxin
VDDLKFSYAGFKPAFPFLRQLLLAFCLVLSSGCRSMPSDIVDLEGNHQDPFNQSHTEVVVFFFISNDCPISNRYAPEMRRLAERFTSRGVRFWLVHPDPQETSADIRKHATEYQLPIPVLRDPKHGIVQLAQVQVTPSAAVFKTDRTLQYHGRIDNRFVDFGKERPEATSHELVDAIEAVLARRPVLTPATTAVGCYIGAVR